MLALPFIAALMWGLYYAISEQSFQYINIPTLYLIGGVFSIAMAFIVSNASGQAINFEFTSSKKGLVLVGALIAITAVGELSTLYATKNISASYAAIGECIYPIFVPIFAYLIWQKLDLNAIQITGALVVILGVGLVVYGQSESSEVITETMQAGADVALAKSG